MAIRVVLGRVGGQGGVSSEVRSLQISDTGFDTPCNPALRDGGGESECASRREHRRPYFVAWRLLQLLAF